ncbi:hypothetical protein DL93DRAFT_2165797 [Clavulina sp. PMI_390]|nr:hypothetical protein DL93DRAFT_2165797 [Clavulina sp. PMI_390]
MSSSLPHANGRVRTVAEVPVRSGSDVQLHQNPHGRLASAASPSSSSFSARRRANTISGEGLGAALAWGSSTDPVLLELNSGRLLNVGNVLDHFTDFQRDMQSFCDKTADQLSHHKGTPQFSPDAAAPKNSPVTKPASDFPSVEEFIYFALLSIVNTRLYNDIFLPFHPCASIDENRRWEEEYRNIIDKELQPQAAAWRAKTFNIMEDNVSTSMLNDLLDRISQSIVDELAATLQDLPGELPLSKEFNRELKFLLHRAYKWNRSIKVDVVQYDFEIFVVEPSSRWDSLQMEPFERLRTAIGVGARVVSPVALGIIGSVSLAGNRVSHVLRKALVLVDEWFKGNARGYTIGTVPPAYNPSRQQPAIPCPPKPIPSSPPVGTITAQPRGTAPMSMLPPSNRERQAPLGKSSQPITPSHLLQQPHPTEQPPSLIDSASSSSSLLQNLFSLAHSEFCPILSVAEFGFLITGSTPVARAAAVTELVWCKERSGVKHEFLLAKVTYPEANPPSQPSEHTNGIPSSSSSPSPDYSAEQHVSSVPARSSTLWVRLDRGAQLGYHGIKSSSGVFPAHDSAALCSNREKLQKSTRSTRKAKVQATVNFIEPPSLIDLANLLSILQEESSEYDAFKGNCYFFCSVIQEMLRERHENVMQGKPLHMNLNPDARQRIRTALNLRYGTPPTG